MGCCNGLVDLFIGLGQTHLNGPFFFFNWIGPIRFLDWADPNGSTHLKLGWANGFKPVPYTRYPDPDRIPLRVEILPGGPSPEIKS
jgi:hypothetical protein